MSLFQHQTRPEATLASINVTEATRVYHRDLERNARGYARAAIAFPCVLNSAGTAMPARMRVFFIIITGATALLTFLLKDIHP